MAWITTTTPEQARGGLRRVSPFNWQCVLTCIIVHKAIPFRSKHGRLHSLYHRLQAPCNSAFLLLSTLTSL